MKELGVKGTPEQFREYLTKIMSQSEKIAGYSENNGAEGNGWEANYNSDGTRDVIYTNGLKYTQAFEHNHDGSYTIKYSNYENLATH